MLMIQEIVESEKGMRPGVNGTIKNQRRGMQRSNHIPRLPEHPPTNGSRMRNPTRLMVVIRVTMVQRDIGLTIHDVLCDLFEGRLPSVRHV